MADIHVIPIKDMRPHLETRTCWCRPEVEGTNAGRDAIVIHAAADGRDLVERHGKQ